MIDDHSPDVALARWQGVRWPRWEPDRTLDRYGRLPADIVISETPPEPTPVRLTPSHFVALSFIATVIGFATFASPLIPVAIIAVAGVVIGVLHLKAHSG